MEDHAEQTELRGTIQAALAQFPDDQRLGVVLCDVQGLDYSEIAFVMHCSLGTVKSRINRARGNADPFLERGELLHPGSVILAETHGPYLQPPPPRRTFSVR